MKTKDLPDEDVRIRVSSCPECKGWVRVAVVHMMDAKDRASFMSEVHQHELSVNDKTLREYRNGTHPMCECRTKT